MRRFVSVLLFVIILGSVLSSDLRGRSISQADSPAALALQFYPVNVQAGGSMIATLYGYGDTGSVYLDVRFRFPGSDVDQVVTNWQRGLSSAHAVPTDTIEGTWLITGFRVHEEANDHSADFFPVSAPLTVVRTVGTGGTFTVTGQMSEARRAHTATLLSDGRVLVAGGAQPNSGIRSAEIYDSETGTFSPAGMMTTPRWWHTATWLPNGKVLLAGGYGATHEDHSIEVQSSAELYDPFTKTFTPTGNMTSPQVGHTATLLTSGKVLIVGGFRAFGGPPCPCIADAQLYDPATGVFTAIAWPLLPLIPTTNLLIDGRVFLASGADTPEPDPLEGAFGTGQFYDPVTGMFSYVGDPGDVTRYAPIWHTGTLLTNGEVLLAGGAIPEGPFYSASAGIFSPILGTFRPIVSMMNRRSLHTATLLPDGRVLLAGGQFPTVASAEVYDPSSGVFGFVGSMTTQRSTHTATLLRNGAVLIAGGDGAGVRDIRAANTAELYNAASGLP